MTRILKRTVFALIALGLGVCLIEGASSLAVFFYDALVRSQSFGGPPQKDIRYDPGLGWVTPPGLRLEGYYGPGADLHTSSRGFRGARETTDAAPAGTTRILCSGDSFTFGMGVADSDAWPALLEARHPGIETVNLAVCGYGLDQACLRFLRDGSRLSHTAHVMAFYTGDLDRMRSRKFCGAGKPLLRLTADGFVVDNVPVPPSNVVSRWIASNYKVLGDLGTVEMLRKARRRIRGARAEGEALSEEQARDAAALLFAELDRVSRAQGGKLALVLLPTLDDYTGHEADPVRAWLRGLAEARGLGFLDGIEALRRVPPAEVSQMFLSDQRVLRSYEAGHYSASGSRFIAEAVHEAVFPAPGPLLSEDRP